MLVCLLRGVFWGKLTNVCAYLVVIVFQVSLVIKGKQRRDYTHSSTETKITSYYIT